MKPTTVLALFFMSVMYQVMAAGTAFDPVRLIGKGCFPKLADLDGDGDLDVVALKNVAVMPHTQLFTPIWQENRGTTFTEHLVTDWQCMYITLEPADLDGDGDMDLVIAMGGVYKITEGITPLAWLENDGAKPPHFIPHSLASFPAGLGLYGFCPADLDGDGDLDVVVSYGSTNDQENKGYLYFYENDGGKPPRFIPHQVMETQKPLDGQLIVADVNGDGRLDVLTNIRGGGTVLYQNQGGEIPTFKQMPVSPNAGQIRAADLNGDGWTDVLIGFSWAENRGGDPTTFTTHLLTQDFQASTFDYGEMIVGDLDRDGHPDPVAYNPAGGTTGSDLRWFHNDGRTSPTFVMQTIGADHLAPVVGDLDGDGNPDIVCENGLYQQDAVFLKWYRNQLPLQPVTVLAPNEAGRAFASGGPMTIQWRTDVTAAGKTVVLELWHGMKTKVAWLANSSNDQGRGMVTVTLPPVPTGSDYRIRAVSASNRALADFSDESFCIRNIPNGIKPAHWSCYP